MKEQIWNPGAPVRKEDRDHERESIQEGIRERVTDSYTHGALDDSQFAGESLPFELSAGATDLEINVGSGVGFGNHDASTDRPEEIDASDATKSGGERIVIPQAETLAGQNFRDEQGAGTGTGPPRDGEYKETTDGLGGFTSTPESSLTRNVPLTALSVNYIWLGHLKTVDETETVNHKETAEILYPKGEAGYRIRVTTSATAPLPDMFLLGTADVTGGGAPVFDQSAMPIARLRPKRVSTSLDASLVPSSYTTPSTITLEDHVNAVGAGTVSATNAHGNTIEDFGVDFQDVDLISHRKQHHTKGVIGDGVTTTSSAYPDVAASTPVAGDEGIVFVKQLISGEEVVVDGKRYTEILPKLLAAFAPAQIGDAYVSFGPTSGNDVVGAHVVYLVDDGAGNLELRERTGTSTGDTELPVAIINWDGSIASITTDERKFGLTGNKDIQDDSIETAHLQDDSVDSDKLADNSVDNAALQTDSVSLAKMQNDSVDTPELVDSAVETAKINDLAVVEAKIGPAAVTSAKLGDDSVLSQHIEVADATDPSDPNTGNGIATAHIRDGAITLDKLSAGVASAAQWTKYTVPHDAAEWLGTGNSGSRAIFSLEAGGVIHAVVIKHTQSFGGTTVATVEIGEVGDTAKYASQFDVTVPDNDTVFQISNAMNMSSFSVTPVNIFATLDVGAQQVGQTTQGSVDIYVLKSVLPV